MPWKSGGFGMFASTDGTAARYMRLFVHAPKRDEELDGHTQCSEGSRLRYFYVAGWLLVLLYSEISWPEFILERNR